MKEYDGGRMTCFISRDPSLSRGRFLAAHPGQLVDHQEGSHWLNRDRLDEIWNAFSQREGLEEAEKRKMEERCSRGLVSCVNLGWSIPNLQGLSCGISDLQASGLGVAGLGISDLQASGLGAAGLGISDLQASGQDISGLGISDLQASGWGAAGLGTSDLQASGLDVGWGTLGLEASGWSAGILRNSGCGCPDLSLSKPLRLNLLALGDVGSTVLMGLKLLAEEQIEEIGIWDMDPNQMKRWEFEMNQTAWAGEYRRLPDVRIIEREELFDCDVLVFCASKGVPAVKPAAEPKGEGAEATRSGGAEATGSGGTADPVSEGASRSGSGDAFDPGDVRMAQYEANRELIRSFGREARSAGFAGLFAVVSDPVDPLCRALFYASNQGENGNFDGAGLKPEQIQGYGLGVMNARAAYFAQKYSRFASFLEEGRAFGPHGQDLVIANSISQYDDPLSREMTRLAAEANLTMRKIGFKPYVAPALSSAVIPLIQTVSGQWHYSSYFLGGVFMGSKNRLTAGGIETEILPLPSPLEMRIQTAYDRLKAIQP